MLYDSHRNRILYPDGTSEFGVEDFCLKMVKGELTDKDYVIEGVDAQLYEKYYGHHITVNKSPDYPEPQKQHTDGELEYVKSRIFQSNRFNHTNQEFDRIEHELEFFCRTQNIRHIKHLIHVIDHFKENQEVWGVGRGSSCSSFVLYLLEVHDVNPLKHDIPFSELSKELE